MSLFELKNIRGEQGAMAVEPAVDRIPKTEKAREALREEIKKNDLVYGVVVSEDFTLTAVIAIINTRVSDTRVLSLIRDIIESPDWSVLFLASLPFFYVRGSFLLSSIRIPIIFSRILPLLYS
ncbi:MAG: hypothetical protein JXB88_11600 [Spirochaetales bacterium]|nr:hypothetical protein [Spirochaetales bacterium]